MKKLLTTKISIDREAILVPFLVISVLFLFFYWTHNAFESYRSGIRSQTAELGEKLEKTRRLADTVANAAKSTKKLNDTLTTYLQTVGAELKMAEKVISVKPVTATGKLEVVNVRLEGLIYDEVISFVQKAESFDNTMVRSMTLTHRFDNPKRADVVLEIARGK